MYPGEILQNINTDTFLGLRNRWVDLQLVNFIAVNEVFFVSNENLPKYFVLTVYPILFS